MGECNNCGSFVTDDYIRVREPDDAEKARCCPNCPDLIRDGAEIRTPHHAKGGDEKD